MKIPRARIAALTVIAALGLALAAAIPAQADTGPWNIWEANATQAVGANCISGGCQVIEVSHPGRDMFWHVVGTDQHGNDYGYWKFSNGNFMASNNTCGGVTIKTSAASDGTIWTRIDGFKFASRLCSGGAGDYSIVLGGHNENGAQFDLCANPQGGCYEQMTLNPS